MWSKMSFKDKLIYNYVTLCGLGKLPGGGTWASLLVLCLVLWSPLGTDPYPSGLLLWIALITMLSIGLIGKSLSYFKSKDPKEIVIDEVSGMAFSLMIVGIFSDIFGEFKFILPEYLSNRDLMFIITFVIFRMFDISKIGPVGWIEDPKKAPSWWQKMESNSSDDASLRIWADDFVAGVLSAVVVICALSIYLGFYLLGLWVLQ